jgi:RNA polymerase sigma factor (sigma-70 family)
MTSASLAFLRTQSDSRLVALARDGHERAFEAMVERHRRSLLAHARRLLPEARAEDALQQALLAAWTALQRGDDVRDLRPWLHRILHNTALNALRVSGYDHEDLREALSLADAPQEEIERRLVMRRTLAGLAALPERQREALLRTAVEGRSQDEVAQALGLSHGALRQLVHRARTTLRAAATVLTPLPVATWLAAAGTRAEPVAQRISEIAAGAGSASVSATLAKAGVVGVLAGGAAIGGPAVVERTHPQTRARAAAGTTKATHPVREAAPATAPAAAVPVAARPRTIPVAVKPRPVTHKRYRSHGSGGRRGGGDDEDQRGSGGRPAPTRSPGGGSDDNGGGDEGRGSGSSGSHESGGDDEVTRPQKPEGGEGGEDEGHAPVPIVASPEPVEEADGGSGGGGDGGSDGSHHGDD